MKKMEIKYWRLKNYQRKALAVSEKILAAELLLPSLLFAALFVIRNRNPNGAGSR